MECNLCRHCKWKVNKTLFIPRISNLIFLNTHVSFVIHPTIQVEDWWCHHILLILSFWMSSSWRFPCGLFLFLFLYAYSLSYKLFLVQRQKQELIISNRDSEHTKPNKAWNNHAHQAWPLDRSSFSHVMVFLYPLSIIVYYYLIKRDSKLF